MGKGDRGKREKLTEQMPFCEVGEGMEPPVKGSV